MTVQHDFLLNSKHLAAAAPWQERGRSRFQPAIARSASNRNSASSAKRVRRPNRTGRGNRPVFTHLRKVSSETPRREQTSFTERYCRISCDPSFPCPQEGALISSGLIALDRLSDQQSDQVSDLGLLQALLAPKASRPAARPGRGYPQKGQGTTGVGLNLLV